MTPQGATKGFFEQSLSAVGKIVDECWASVRDACANPTHRISVATGTTELFGINVPKEQIQAVLDKLGAKFDSAATSFDETVEGAIASVKGLKVWVTKIQPEQ